MAQPIIEVRHLAKSYQIGTSTGVTHACRKIIRHGASRLLGRPACSVEKPREFWALKDINFDVYPGQVVGIIGHNGAGKSTLLKVLSRITSPTLGQAKIRGRMASLLEVGTGFHPELTGRENIYLNGTILGMRKAEIDSKLDQIIDFSGVEQFLDTPVKRYSSGMCVRLAFAVASHLEPELLVIDEVLAVGDAAFQRKCLGKIGQVARGGRTVLFVSHDMSAVQKLCDSAILLQDGKVVKHGDCEDVVASYLNQMSEGLSLPSQDLSALPRGADASGDIRFQKSWIQNAEGKPTNTLRFGEPFRVCMQAHSQRDYDDLSMVVAIDTAVGGRLLTAVSDENGKTYHVKAEGQLNIEAAFDQLTLMPGVYQLSLAIRSGRLGLDTLLYPVSFEVLPLVYGNTPPSSGTMGTIRTATQWRALDTGSQHDGDARTAA